jgi:hypothetical protein
MVFVYLACEENAAKRAETRKRERDRGPSAQPHRDGSAEHHVNDGGPDVAQLHEPRAVDAAVVGRGHRRHVADVEQVQTPEHGCEGVVGSVGVCGRSRRVYQPIQRHTTQPTHICTRERYRVRRASCKQHTGDVFPQQRSARASGARSKRSEAQAGKGVPWVGGKSR